MYKGMERGVDIIETEICTSKAVQDLISQQESGSGAIQLSETGGPAINYDENIYTRHTGGEIPS